VIFGRKSEDNLYHIQNMLKKSGNSQGKDVLYSQTLWYKQRISAIL